MREERKQFFGREVLQAFAFVLLVFAAVLTLDVFSVVSHAESQGKAKVNAKVRQSPTTKSEVVDGVMANEAITVTGQIQGTDDGQIWYQVLTKENKVGYVRSDLLTITSGTPPTLNPDGTVQTPVQNNEAGVFVSVKPVSTTVTGTSPARVRAEASSSATLLKTAEPGVTLTVIGYEYDVEGNLWFKVKYSTNNEEVVGFIRSDYIAIQKEQLEPAEDSTPDPVQEDPTPTTPVVTETKEYDTLIQDGEWMLVDNTQSPAVGWPIQPLLKANEENEANLKDAQDANKKKSTWLTLCIIIIIALVAIIAIGFIKMRDMVEEADMLAAEKATTNRRSADRPQGSRGTAVRPQGQQAARNPQSAKNPAAARPGQAGETRRPAAGQNPQTKNPVSPRPEKAPQSTAQQPKAPAAAPVRSQAHEGQQAQQTKKPRNIMDDNDEFEFEFLNKGDWDKDEK